jgi:glyoxylase-like metal-dependent hydrolase (beta-lactamase superfamily II)
MDKGSYRFRLGALDCTVVSDGTHTYHDPAPVLFVNASQDRLEQALRGHGLDPARWNAYVSPYPTLLIDAGRSLVLVDTGAGDMAPSTGKLLANLEGEKVAPGDIDVVILTHAHRDHSGGIIDAEGRPTFPNARYVMWREEWSFWTSAPDSSEPGRGERLKQRMGAWPRDSLPSIQGQLELIERETEVVPGVRAVAAPGHTPGHMAVALVSSGEKLLYISDAALHAIHLEQPDWYAAVDVAPEQALASRRRLAERAVTDRALVHAFHYPYPGLGHIVPQGDAWQWQPIETAG